MRIKATELLPGDVVLGDWFHLPPLTKHFSRRCLILDLRPDEEDDFMIHATIRLDQDIYQVYTEVDREFWMKDEDFLGGVPL